MVGEFDIIRRFFTRPAKRAILGVGDDAALIAIPPDIELAVSTDMLLEGRHFFANADPRQLGHKALAVNLSDMAAMGAEPRWVTLALALPKADEHWLEAFSCGFSELAHAHQVELIGGDTCRGALTLCVQIMGEVPKGEALRRDGAKAGEDIWVSGKLGDAALTLAHLKKQLTLSMEELARCSPALHTPTPRVALGKSLRGIATSAIDISDGLMSDLKHVLERSQVGAVIELEKIPGSDILNRQPPEIARNALLSGGDDYELCFTAKPREREKIDALSRQLELSLTCIGRTKGSRGLTLLDERGRALDYKAQGFDHFG
ncbi:MAG TPA: thiamine-phosphate kinase [Burkholderiales bacterium]|nr:thiamine-phosphate kinase [Burkholderiales bacterium]